MPTDRQNTTALRIQLLTEFIQSDEWEALAEPKGDLSGTGVGSLSYRMCVVLERGIEIGRKVERNAVLAGLERVFDNN